MSSRSALIRDLVPWNRQSPSAASTTSWRQYDCVVPVPLRGLRTKNLDAERRNEEPLFCSPRTGPRSWTKDQGRVFVFSCFSWRTEGGERRTFFQALLNQEPGRGASERGTALLLSKDGSTILDEGRRTRLRLFMLFSEDGERWTFFQALLNQEPGRVASERGTWAQRAGTALLLFRRTALLYSAFHDLFG